VTDTRNNMTPVVAAAHEQTARETERLLKQNADNTGLIFASTAIAHSSASLRPTVRRQNLSELRLVARENAPASMASIAALIASASEELSLAVTNSSSLVRPAIKARPLVRRTRARHLPRSRS
jgi:hypothetical protein